MSAITGEPAAINIDAENFDSDKAERRNPNIGFVQHAAGVLSASPSPMSKRSGQDIMAGLQLELEHVEEDCDDSREEMPETCPEPLNSQSADGLTTSDRRMVIKKSSQSDVESQLERNGIKCRDSELSDIAEE